MVDRTKQMKFGVMFANGDRGAEPVPAATLAMAAENGGFESLWAVQHVVMPVDHRSKYPYSSAGTVPGGGGDTRPPGVVDHRERWIKPKRQTIKKKVPAVAIWSSPSKLLRRVVRDELAEVRVTSKAPRYRETRVRVAPD
jgi:hypothetical protein